MVEYLKMVYLLMFNMLFKCKIYVKYIEKIKEYAIIDLNDSEGSSLSWSALSGELILKYKS